MEVSIPYVNSHISPKAETKWVEGACFSAFFFSLAFCYVSSVLPLTPIFSRSWLFENIFHTIRYFGPGLLQNVDVCDCFLYS